MEEILATFRDYCEKPYERAAQIKAAGKTKIIGCLPMYFPEEIIHAAGALPVTLFGSDDPITLGDGHLMTNACDQVRSSFDSLLKGKYDFLDGIAAIYICDQVRFYLEVWQLDHPVDFFHHLPTVGGIHLQCLLMNEKCCPYYTGSALFRQGGGETDHDGPCRFIGYRGQSVFDLPGGMGPFCRNCKKRRVFVERNLRDACFSGKIWI